MGCSVTLVSTHQLTWCGVASYWLEFFEQVQSDVVLVPTVCLATSPPARRCLAASAALPRASFAYSGARHGLKHDLRNRRSVEALVTTWLADGMVPLRAGGRRWLPHPR